MIQKALKVRIYPNKIQQEQINKNLGCVRFIYNQMLYERKQVYELLKENKRELYEYQYKTEKDYKEEFEWLKEVDSASLQQSRVDLISAYSNFFKSLKKQRKGKSGFPKFKRRKGKSTYRAINNNGCIKIDYENKKIKLPKLEWIKFSDNRIFEGEIKNATISRTSSGKYFVSVLYEINEEIKENSFSESKIKITGLDMSLENFFINEIGSSPNFNYIG
jgi:putative transposase